MKARQKIFILLCLLLINFNISVGRERNLVLIILDGFRHDYLTKEYSPNLMDLSETGVKAKTIEPVFPTVFFPNYISLLSGCYPENHGIIANEFINHKTKDKFTSSLGNSSDESYWYNMPLIWETAGKHNISTSSIMLPATSFAEKFRNPDNSIKRTENLTIETRITETIKQLKSANPSKSNLIAVYFGELDEEAHTHGPESDEVKNMVREIDASLGVLADSINNTDLAENTDLLILSFYGLSNVIKFQTLNLTNAFDSTAIEIYNAGAYAYVYGENEQITEYKKQLDSSSNIVTGFLQKDIPVNLKIKNNVCAPDLLILSNYGWLLSINNQVQNSELKGVHGYMPGNPEMNGLFIASGNSFKSDFEIPTIRIIDIHPLICKLLGITPLNLIDGKLENIREILK